MTDEIHPCCCGQSTVLINLNDEPEIRCLHCKRGVIGGSSDALVAEWNDWQAQPKPKG